jgi:5-methylcytosine-specific restriction endonuclease McrA
MSIISLLGQIKNDEIVLPAIQRDFVWEEEKIQRLLDSILRGYPVGIALLWETYHPLQYRSFIRDYRPGTLASFSDNDAGKRLRVVLDGQQRLQSLYIALFGSFEGKDLCFDVLSGKDRDDVSEAKFIFEFFDSAKLKYWNDYVKEQLAKPEEDRATDFCLWYYIKASDLFGMSAGSREKLVTKVHADLGLSVEDVTRLRVNLSAFDYAISKDETSLKLSVIDENLSSESEERKSEADVLEIFVRVNTAGTRLNRSDLIFSMLKLNWKESSEALPDFVHRVNKGNSVGLTTDLVIRCLFAVSDLGAKFSLDLLRNRKNVQTLRDNFTGCCNGIRAAVDFLTQRCWIHNSQLIGGQTTLVPFVYYFFHTKNHRIPNSSIPRARQALYLFGFSRCFSRYGDSRVGAFIRDALKPLVDVGDESFPVDKAMGWVSHWERVNDFDTDLLQRNHHLTLHLVQEMTGAQVQYEGNFPEVDHIFPRATLREKGFDEGIINNFANFWILAREKNRNKSDSHPKKYFENVDDQEMKRALIERNMLDFRQYQSFIRVRSQQMVDKVRAKLGVPPGKLSDAPAV